VNVGLLRLRLSAPTEQDWNSNRKTRQIWRERLEKSAGEIKMLTPLRGHLKSSVNMTVPSQITSVLLIDDHPAVRFGLRQLIETNPKYSVGGEAAGFQSGYEAFQSTRPDIVVADILVADGNGIDFLKRLRSEGYDTGILIVTALDEMRPALRAFHAGANGYMRKTDSVQDLVPALETISKGGRFIPSKLSQDPIFKLFSDLGADGLPSVLGKLSARQREIFDLMGAGLRTGEISERLEMSPKTADTHLQHMKEKFGFSADMLRAFAEEVVAFQKLI
jgi:DNA-binding NarL/FixJ family response regulator